MKKNIFLAILILISIRVGAQDNEKIDAKKDSYKPTKGSFTVGLNLGKGSFITTGFSITDGQGSVSGDASTSVIDANDNSATNMIGIEGRYFINDNWAISLSGGMLYSSTPASLSIPAVIDQNTGETILPAYDAVVSDKRLDVNYTIGAQYFFKIDNKKLLPYVGALLPFNHSTRSLYNPTINPDGSIQDLGSRNLDIFGYGLQAVAGIDYFITDSFYFGVSIKPLSFIQTFNTKYPAPGLYSRKVSNSSFSSFVQPLITVGFKL